MSATVQFDGTIKIDGRERVVTNLNHVVDHYEGWRVVLQGPDDNALADLWPDDQAHSIEVRIGRWTAAGMMKVWGRTESPGMVRVELIGAPPVTDVAADSRSGRCPVCHGSMETDQIDVGLPGQHHYVDGLRLCPRGCDPRTMTLGSAATGTEPAGTP